MSSAVARSSRYSYRASSTGGGIADVNIEYSADLSALSRLEVKWKRKKFQFKNGKKKIWKCITKFSLIMITIGSIIK